MLLKNNKFNLLTNIFKCIFVIAYFEMKYLLLNEKIVIANYLTIAKLLNFKKKEIGFC